VVAVGWAKLLHRCQNCGVTSRHVYRHGRAAALLAVGVLACWAVAFGAQHVFDLSFDVTLLLALVLGFILSALLIGRVANACSTWQAVSENPST